MLNNGETKKQIKTISMLSDSNSIEIETNKNTIYGLFFLNNKFKNILHRLDNQAKCGLFPTNFYLLEMFLPDKQIKLC